MRALRARPSVARRYLALEGRRVLAELTNRVPLAAALCSDGETATATAERSLEIATGRADVADAPKWFGVIKPSRLLASAAGSGTPPTDKDLRQKFDVIDPPELEDDGDDDHPSEEGKILKLFETPLFNSRALSDFLRKCSAIPSPRGVDDAGAELQVRSIRRAGEVGPNARPLPTRIHFTDDGEPGAAVGIGGVIVPEWDVHNNGIAPTGAGSSTFH